MSRIKPSVSQYLKSSVGKKQIVAITGLLLILFLIFHLSGNLLFFLGAGPYNAFSQGLENMGWLLECAEWGLSAIFIVHIVMTAQLVIENKKARKTGYAVQGGSVKSWAARMMPVTGSIILIYLIFHLLDFTLGTHASSLQVVAGKNLGLWGQVYNTLSQPVRMIGYEIAMIAIGLHLSHAIQSVWQSLGIYTGGRGSMVTKISYLLGILFAVAFGSIPIYIFWLAHF